MQLEVAQWETDPDALFITLKLRFRVTNDSGSYVKSGSSVIDTYVVQGGRNRYINSTSVIFPNISQGQSNNMYARIVIDPNAVYLIDQGRSPDGNVNLRFILTGIQFSVSQTNASVFTPEPFFNLTADLRIGMSDWVTISQPWGKEFTLVVFLPESKKKLEQLQKTLRLSNLDEVVDEAFELLHSKKEEPTTEKAT